MSSHIAFSRRWRSAAVAVIFLAAASMTSCSPKPSSAGRDLITVVAGSSGVNLNPYTNVLSSRQVGSLLFRGLLAVDASGMPAPDLALEVPTKGNGGMSSDGTTITYRLDPKARWADGKALTADDVVYTWGLIKSGILTDDPRGMDNVRQVVALDGATVQLQLRRPDAPLAWHFIPYILPKHLLEGSPDVLSDDFWFHPVGSRGRLAGKSVKSTQVDLVDAEGNGPTIRVVFAENESGARKVWDSVDNCVWLSPPVEPAGAEKSDSVPSARWQAFLMNPSPGHPTAELAVRQAFAEVATVSVSPGAIGPYGQPIPEWKIKKTAAERELDSAGWVMGKGGRRYKDGQPLSVTVLFNPISAAEGDRIEYVIGKEIKQLGAKVEPKATSPYVQYQGASRLVLGRFDVALMEFPIGVPHGWAWPFYSKDVPSDSNPAGLNIARIADPELDAAYDRMRAAGSPDELDSAMGDGWERLQELRLVLWDRQLPQTVMYKGLEGVKAQPFEEYALRSADEWRLAGVQNGE